MSKKSFKDMTDREQKEFKQRQILINEAIEKGSFNNRRDVKAWMKDYFKLSEPLDEVSTEYSLSAAQSRLFYKWLMHFTGRGPRPYTNRAKALVTKKQLHRVDELQQQLGWDLEDLTKFVKRQTGKNKLVPSLWKFEATKLITGMERILAEQPFKAKG